MPGVAGSMWFTGTGTGIEVTVENTKVGDIYFNTTTCDLYQCVDENTWNWLSNLKGDTGQPGSTGVTGAAWLTGTAVTGTGSEINATVTNARVGDLYFNTETCDIYQCTAENTWNWISNIKGDKGEDGTSVYVGYDGYIWEGTEKTNYQAVISGEGFAENTLGLYGNKYFTQNEVSTINPIALMNNYFPTINKTCYSGTQISEISVYAKTAGILEIGTASLNNIVEARTTGSTLSTTSTAYELQAGLNTIPLNLIVSETDTIVLGGGTSNVTLYSYEEVNGNDEYGFHTICDKTTRSELFEETNNKNDKLVVSVKASAVTLGTINEGFNEDLQAVDSSAWSFPTPSSDTGYYSLVNNTNVGTIKVNKVTIPVTAVATLNSPVFVLAVINVSDNQVLQTYNITLPSSEFTNCTDSDSDGWYEVNKFITVELETPLTINTSTEKLGFSIDKTAKNTIGGYIKMPDNLDWRNSQSDLRGSGADSNFGDQFGLYYGITAEYTKEFTFAEHLENLQEEETAEALKKNS